jgi:hypothetical protein
MHYEINVSLNGKHYFGTHERSLLSEQDTRTLLRQFRESFPEARGFKVEAVKVEKVTTYLKW